MGSVSAATANQTQVIDKEAVRLLAIEHGVREAARMLGLSEDRVRQWSHRYKWFEAKSPHHLAAVTNVTTLPGDAHLSELAEHERETKLSLARYSRRAAKDAEQLSVREAPLVHKVGQLAGIVHKWGEEKSSATFTLNVLNINSIEQGQE